jgi:glycosyltransferase involved in cell wall biosynthesis
MEPLKIKLVTLGNLKYPINFASVEKWRSQVFTAKHVDIVQEIEDADIEHWAYSDNSLKGFIKPDPNFDITVGLINAPLEFNYYTRRLENNICVLSLHETADILKLSNLKIENFILRIIYQLCCYYIEAGHKLPTSFYSVGHDETRGCLFDMNMNKADIIYSTERPRICDSCRNRIIRSQVPKDFLSSAEIELRRIKKDLYYRIADFIKNHPVYSILITLLTGILLNIAASYLYDMLIKPLLGIGTKN